MLAIPSESTAAQSSASSASKMAFRTCAVRSQMSTVCACAGSMATASIASSNLIVSSLSFLGSLVSSDSPSRRLIRLRRRLWSLFRRQAFFASANSRATSGGRGRP